MRLPSGRGGGAGKGSGSVGLSAPEAIVALLLGLFIVHLALSSMARLRTTERRLAKRADGLVAMRVTDHVLRRELRYGVAGRDWTVDRDSLSLRAFRGTGLVCPYDSTTTEIVVSYDGDRAPDAAKDSVLLVTPLGRAEVRAFAGSVTAPSPCGATPAGELRTWTLDSAVEPGIVLARLFERGSYHLALSALRYRRGSSGRQPLTPEVWAGSTGWSIGDGRLGLEVRPRAADVGRPWSAFLAWTDPE
ncbi:MAG: hypothetical protein PVJ80_12310 [Gemmatimonadota bacterium]